MNLVDTETIKWITKDFKIAVWNEYGNDIQCRYSSQNISRLSRRDTKKHFNKQTTENEPFLRQTSKRFIHKFMMCCNSFDFRFSCSDPLVGCWRSRNKTRSVWIHIHFNNVGNFVFLLKTISSDEHWKKDQKRNDLLHFTWFFAGQLLIECKMSECKIPWYISTIHLTSLYRTLFQFEMKMN